MHFFLELQFASNCYTVVSYQALFSLSVYKNSAVYLSGAKILCFCMIHDLGSPTIYYTCNRIIIPVIINTKWNRIDYNNYFLESIETGGVILSAL